MIQLVLWTEETLNKNCDVTLADIEPGKMASRLLIDLGPINAFKRVCAKLQLTAASQQVGYCKVIASKLAPTTLRSLLKHGCNDSGKIEKTRS